ncbi:MAG: hypothetical protein ABSB41_16860 [Anaerolineales bacterium]|jgi:hypothetical protein
MKYTIALINTDTGQQLAGTAHKAVLLLHAGWAVYEEGRAQPVQVFAGDCAGELLAKKEAAAVSRPSTSKKKRPPPHS